MDKQILEYAKELYRKHFGLSTQAMVDKCWNQATIEYRNAWLLIASTDLDTDM